MATTGAPTDEEIGRAARPLLELLGFLRTPTREDDLLSVADAAHVAGTSPRVVADAVRAREIVSYGKRRGPKSIKRSDLDAWIASRRIVHAPIDDADLEKRIARLRRAKAANDGSRKATTR